MLVKVICKISKRITFRCYIWVTLELLIDNDRLENKYCQEKEMTENLSIFRTCNVSLRVLNPHVLNLVKKSVLMI